MKFALCVFLFSFSILAKWGDIKTISSGRITAKQYNEVWHKAGMSDKQAVARLFEVLTKTRTGKLLLKKAISKAKKYKKDLMSLVLPGEHSLTDTTLVRRFSAEDPSKVSFEARSKVYINKYLPLSDAVLDLAHELTHFAMRDTFNPYRKNYGLKKFVKSTIEGKGGEVEAYLVECQVSSELFNNNREGKCDLVVDDKTGKLSSSKGHNQFYRLGDHYREFSKKIKKHSLKHDDFYKTSDEEALFISSAYGIPYPLAAVHEFEMIMGKVCQNDKNRLNYMKSSRAIASEEKYKSLHSGFESRCAKYL
jgi:hypothetical protein